MAAEGDRRSDQGAELRRPARLRQAEAARGQREPDLLDLPAPTRRAGSISDAGSGSPPAAVGHRPLAAGEPRRALLGERCHALDEVLRAPELVLELGFERELRVEIAVQRAVQRLLGSAVGPGGPGGQAPRQGLRLGLETIVGMDPVDQAQSSAWAALTRSPSSAIWKARALPT